MDKTVNATKVNEYTIRGDILNCTFNDIAFLKLLHHFCPLGLELCLNESLV